MMIDMARTTFDKWYAWSQEITSKEIRAMLTEFVKKSGVPFREKGGTYSGSQMSTVRASHS